LITVIVKSGELRFFERAISALDQERSVRVADSQKISIEGQRLADDIIDMNVLLVRGLTHKCSSVVVNRNLDTPTAAAPDPTAHHASRRSLLRTWANKASARRAKSSYVVRGGGSVLLISPSDAPALRRISIEKLKTLSSFWMSACSHRILTEC
jgi:hypothetical protein